VRRILSTGEPIIRRLAGNGRIPRVGTATRARGRPLATATAILRPGDVLGGFRVDDVIGIGGMAIVYRAEQVSLGRPVALKVLSSKLTNDEVFRERFRREGMHAAALEHPNIVPVYDSDEQDGLLYLAMRLVEGTNLAELIQARGLTADQTVEILRPIASALDTAHAGGLIHRDVKPQNILITDQGHPYLADFGVAKGSNTAGLTATGGFVGSVNYASPEQIKGLTLTSASDIYALTAVLYQCLTGRVPYPRETDAGIMHAHLTEPPPTLPVAAGADSDFHSVFARGMAKDPGARYGHAGDLINAAALSVDRMPSVRRKAVPSFPDEPSEQAGTADSAKPAIEGTEIVSRDELAKLHSTESHTTADRRRTPAPELEPEVAAAPRRWRLIAGIGIGGVAAVVAILLVVSSGGGTQANAQRRGSSSESAELARFAGQLSRSLAPTVAARANLTGLSSSRLSTRAATARAIASADGRSATALSKLAPQPRDQQAVRSLARALEGERSALDRLASGASTDNSSAYASATAATKTAYGQLSSARAALYGMGFTGLPALRALSIRGLPPVQHDRKPPAKAISTTSTPVVTAPAPEKSTVTQTPTPAPSVPTPSAPAPTHHSSPQPQTEVAKPLS
jgi:serine/threonine protein kinase